MSQTHDTGSARPTGHGFRRSGRYSALRLLREAFAGHRGWSPAWRKAEPRKQYQVVIVGGGGHGLATAYYLANHFGITDVAVIEKGPIGDVSDAATPPSSARPTTAPRTSASTTFLCSCGKGWSAN